MCSILWLSIFHCQRRQWHPTPVLLPGKSHGWRSLVGCSPWGRKESDTTEQLHFHFSLSCIGEGNGNPLQCSCLENPRDGGAWWLPSMGSHRVGHDWSDFAAAAAAVHRYQKGSDTYTWGIKDFYKCWSESLAKRRLCLGPTGVINCTPLSALSSISIILSCQ